MLTRVSNEQSFRALIKARQGKPPVTSAVDFQLHDITIDGLDAGDVRIENLPNSSFTNVVFRNCVFDATCLDSGSFNNVSFEGCIFKWVFSLAKNSLGCVTTLTFKSCTFRMGAFFYNRVWSHKDNRIRISQCTFEKNVYFRGDGGYSVSDCRGRCTWYVQQNEFLSTFRRVKTAQFFISGGMNIEVSDSTFSDSLWFESFHTISRCTFQSIQSPTVDLRKVTVDDTNFWSCTFGYKEFDGATLSNVDFHNTYVTKEDLADVEFQQGVNLV